MKNTFQIRNPVQGLHPGLTPGLKPAQKGIKHTPLYEHANVERAGRKRGR